MRICILGANGFIGSYLKKAFHTSTALTRENLDLLDTKAVTRYFSIHTYDLIIHCAAVTSQKDDLSILDQNLRMFYNVMNATTCKVYYFSSGASIDTPYGLSKYVIENYNSPRLQILRLWGCFGPNELPTRFLSTIKRNGSIDIPMDQEFDFFHVDDVVHVIRYIMNQPPREPLNLVYHGRKYLLSEVAKMAGATSIRIHGLKQPGYTGTYNLGTIYLPTLRSRITEFME